METKLLSTPPLYYILLSWVGPLNAKIALSAFKIKGIHWIPLIFMGEKWRNIKQPRPVGSCLLFLDLVQSALRYNGTSNIYLGNNGVELSILGKSLSQDKLYFYNKETFEWKIKRLELKDDFSIKTFF